MVCLCSQKAMKPSYIFVSLSPIPKVCNAPKRHPNRLLLSGVGVCVSLSQTRILQDTLRFQSPPSLLERPCLDTAKSSASQVILLRRIHKPCVWLVAVADHSESKSTEESVDEDVLPTFVLVLFTRLDTEQPSSWWVVVFFVRPLCRAERL